MGDLRHTFGKLNLGLSALVEEHKAANGGLCLAVTSAKAKEGKTFVASGLATSVAALGRHRVLLVDANFEAPGLRRLYRQADRPGFSDCLLRDDPDYADEIAAPTPNLFLMFAGSAPNIELLYRRGSIAQFVRNARDRFDLVIFDCGGLNSVGGNGVTDASDKLLLVVDSSATRRELVAHAARRIENDRDDALWGIVLNKKQRYLPNFLYDRL